MECPVRLSRFVLAHRDVLPGEHLLYDVVGDRYVGIDDAGLAAIDRWREAPPAEAEREGAAALAELGLVVEDDAADERRLEEAERKGRAGPADRTYVTLLPTLSCNLACGYCCQTGFPAAGHMDAGTEEATVEFVLGRVAAARSARLTVHYIGGEPLLRADLVLRTARRFAAAMRERGGSFDWELTTNAVLLRSGFVNELLTFGPGAVKVTLDGDRETHDRARVRRDGRGSFGEVMAALLDVARNAPGVSLRLGGNLQGGDEASFSRLLDRLVAEGLQGRLEYIRLKPVIETAGCGAACGNGVAAQPLVQLSRKADRTGLARVQGTGGIDALGACDLHWDNAFVIDPRGRVYRCFAVAGRPEMAVGDVWNGIERSAPLTESQPWRSNDACQSCPFVPVCFGGCLGGAYLATGRTGEVRCRREYFETAFREEVVNRYLAEFHPEAIVPRETVAARAA
jgi:uncharacterized protein